MRGGRGRGRSAGRRRAREPRRAAGARGRGLRGRRRGRPRRPEPRGGARADDLRALARDLPRGTRRDARLRASSRSPTGEVVGYTGLRRRGSTSPTAENLLTAVRRPWRRRGIAVALKREQIAPGTGGRRRADLHDERRDERRHARRQRAGSATAPRRRGSSSAGRWPLRDVAAPREHRRKHAERDEVGGQHRQRMPERGGRVVATEDAVDRRVPRGSPPSRGRALRSQARRRTTSRGRG